MTDHPSTDIYSIAADLAAELRRRTCRIGVSGGPCKHCLALADYDAHIGIVQTPESAAQKARAALRQKADDPGERHD